MRLSLRESSPSPKPRGAHRSLSRMTSFGTSHASVRQIRTRYRNIYIRHATLGEKHEQRTGEKGTVGNHHRQAREGRDQRGAGTGRDHARLRDGRRRPGQSVQLAPHTFLRRSLEMALYFVSSGAGTARAGRTAWHISLKVRFTYVSTYYNCVILSLLCTYN